MDYIKDGIKYCGKCNTPKQATHKFGNREVTLNIKCQCEYDKYHKEKEEFAKKQQQERIKTLQAQGIHDKALLGYTFKNDDSPESKISKVCRKYVERWEDMKMGGQGLLMFGGVGNGKTFYASCIGNALLDKGVSVLMTSFSKILNMDFDERNNLVKKINNFKLLVIDDLGAERQSDFALEQIYTIIDERYKSGLPIIITTNLTLVDLTAATDVRHKRVYDRVIEMCMPLKFKKESRRIEIAKKKMAKLKEVINEN